MAHTASGFTEGRSFCFGQANTPVELPCYAKAIFGKWHQYTNTDNGVPSHFGEGCVRARRLAGTLEIRSFLGQPGPTATIKPPAAEV